MLNIEFAETMRSVGFDARDGINKMLAIEYKSAENREPFQCIQLICDLPRSSAEANLQETQNSYLD